ncbi:basic helix-loop-helix ARNT-like protein 2 isoform X2 [Nerophis ophidion]|uniref:basic helix-loop-helix ARNT-like protein 2 isoform X2 n=1 Tax=Nerophis ophidion TaxID=159077 RepID=UPI002ADFF0F5|nr:basic helix-loop-helix ARNT-like protein 2 isoform X2 [Nerophis ophidion]
MNERLKAGGGDDMFPEGRSRFWSSASLKQIYTRGNDVNYTTWRRSSCLLYCFSLLASPHFCSLSPPHFFSVSPPHFFSLSPPHFFSVSPPHFFSVSPPHLSPPHLSPPHFFSLSPPHFFSLSPPHFFSLSPPHFFSLSPPHFFSVSLPNFECLLHTFSVCLLHTSSVCLLHTCLLHTFSVCLLHTSSVCLLHTFSVCLFQTLSVSPPHLSPPNFECVSATLVSSTLVSSTLVVLHMLGHPAPESMCDGGSEGTSHRGAGGTVEEEGPDPTAADLPRKRKGDLDERSDAVLHHGLHLDMDGIVTRSEGEDQQAKMQCFRQPHRQIEKRRRDKMNNLIEELSAMIPACQPMAAKPDKLSVLRKAVQHLKALKAGSGSTFADAGRKPPILGHEDLRHLLFRVADGFLLVVSCDRAKMLFISESVSKILNFSRVELTGKSLFDFLHPKDISKVKEQMSNSHLMDAATGVQADVAVSQLSSGARRSFFCRMKRSGLEARHKVKVKDKWPLPTTSIKKDSVRYCTLHCSGYMRSWPRSDLDSESPASHLTCLVTMCRLQGHGAHQVPKGVKVKPTQFVARCTIDGKFTFIEQHSTTVIGYLPQELLGTSCYEYFHQDDLQQLAEKHRQVLRSKEKIDTKCKFKTKYGSYVSLQSRWFSFTNPWTKEVEFIVSLNRVISGPGPTIDDEAASSSISHQEESKHLPIVPGLTSGVGKMIYAGSIGTQIANELLDASRANWSPHSGVSTLLGAPHSGVSSPLGAPHSGVSSPLRAPHSGVSSPLGAPHSGVSSPLGAPHSGVSSPLGAPHSGVSSPLGAPHSAPASPQASTHLSSREEEEAGSSSESRPDLVPSMSDCTGQSSQQDLDSMLGPGLSAFSSDEAAMAVIMSLLETDVNMGQSGDLEDLHWPF